jgi:hypothetical protein
MVAQWDCVGAQFEVSIFSQWRVRYNCGAEDAIMLENTPTPAAGDPYSGSADIDPRPSSVPADDSDDDVRPWRGVFAIEFPKKHLCTLEGVIRLDELPAWRPQPTVHFRHIDDDDDE